jgi:RNA polymerase sigma-70 factor (ECF subfamily)
VAKDLKSYEALFRELFKPLCGFAMKYVGDFDEAKNLVHEVFIIVWEKYDTLPADTNFRNYLFTSVRNRSLNYLRDRKKHVALDTLAEGNFSENNSTVETDELAKEIELGINLLPEKCRQIFEMNRHEGLKYAEIADKLGLSIKTVETQMSKALNVLREHLKEFMLFLIIMLEAVK